MHPAIELLILSGTCVLALNPLVAWLLLLGQRDTRANIFFAGSASFAAAGVLFALRGSGPDFLAYTGSQTLVALTLVLWAESLHREIAPPARSRWITLGALAAVVLAYEILAALGMRDLAGHNLFLFTYAVLAFWILVIIQRIRRGRKSRGLDVLALGVACTMVMNLVRVKYSVFNAVPMPLLAFTPLSNTAYVVNFASVVLASFGYLGFVLEKARERAQFESGLAVRAQERERAAQAQAEELAALVRQRDEMLLLNSRFSALSSLAMFNSSLVHELSQPMQALRSLLESQALEGVPTTGQPQEVAGQAEASSARALDLVKRMTAILESLRRLIASQRPDVSPLEVMACVHEILPVLQTEARHRDIELRVVRPPGSTALGVEANRVMLQRVIFNLVTNAFEAVGGQAREEGGSLSASNRWVEVAVAVEPFQGEAHAVIRVSDNGPGLPPSMLGSRFEPFRTGHPGGTGLGLALARLVLESWGGQVEARNLERGGACVTVAMPLRGESP